MGILTKIRLALGIKRPWEKYPKDWARCSRCGGRVNTHRATYKYGRVFHHDCAYRWTKFNVPGSKIDGTYAREVGSEWHHPSEDTDQEINEWLKKEHGNKIDEGL